jgi:hypothetical protein
LTAATAAAQEVIEMSKDLTKRRCWAFVLPALLLSVPPIAALAKEQAVATVQRVAVYPKYYAAGGKRFVDLEKLDQWVKSTGTRSLEFHSCMWTATERLAAAIERFQHVYLDVRWIAPGKSGCPAVERVKEARTSGPG